VAAECSRAWFQPISELLAAPVWRAVEVIGRVARRGWGPSCCEQKEQRAIGFKLGGYFRFLETAHNHIVATGYPPSPSGWSARLDGDFEIGLAHPPNMRADPSNIQPGKLPLELTQRRVFLR